jgi:hypothetical protein
MANEPTRDITEILLNTDAFLEAAREAADDAIQLHKKMGLPMAVSRDGHPAWVAPEKLERSDQESPNLRNSELE